jgi:divalent metal cation (Fe/Co/Zn/Cd) transporter
MDPVEQNNEHLDCVRNQVAEAVSQMDALLSIHDFRMVVGETQINLIFDLVVPVSYSREQRKEICQTLRRRMHEVDDRYQCVIQVENSFMAEER